MIRIERLHFKGMAIYPSLYGVNSLEKGGWRTSSILPCYLGHFCIVGRGWTKTVNSCKHGRGERKQLSREMSLSTETTYWNKPLLPAQLETAQSRSNRRCHNRTLKVEHRAECNQYLYFFSGEVITNLSSLGWVYDTWLIRILFSKI